MPTKVYGTSDDLIEIEGAIREEFNPHDDDEPSFLAFSDGTVLSIEYTRSGIWAIHRVQAGSAAYSKTDNLGEDSDQYTDTVTLRGDIKWCVFGSRIEVGQ